MVARVVHFVMASFAVTGTAVIGWALWQTNSPTGQTDYERAAKWGARLALVPTILQIPVGVWTLSQLPVASQQPLLGGDAVGTGLLLISVLAAFWLMHQLSAVALGDTKRASLIKVILTMMIVIILMTAVLRISHQ